MRPLRRPLPGFWPWLVPLSGLLLLVVFLMLSETANEYIEHKLVKGRHFHTFMQTSKGKTSVPAQDELIVFVHIPRTSGETLKIALFNDLAYQFNPEWMDDVHCAQDCGAHFDCAPLSWLCRRFPDRARNDDQRAPPVPWLVGGGWVGQAGETPAELRRRLRPANVVQGFFSRADISQLRAAVAPRRLRLFTVLRHPIERALSFYGMCCSSGCRVPWYHDCSAAGRREHGPPVGNAGDYFRGRVRGDVGPALRQRLEDYVVSYGRNTMTWQLGHHMHARHRNISAADALAQAKAFLTSEEMAFVGFFDDMLRDFPRLARTVFPHARGSWLYSLFYQLGAVFGFPRMRTLKYAQHLSAGDRAAVEEANALDMELYDWARQHFGKQHLVMHESYAAFALAFAPYVVVGGAAVAFTVQWCCLAGRWGQGKKRGAEKERLS